MITITQRPPKYSYVGGIIPNPIEYELTRDAGENFAYVDIKNTLNETIASLRFSFVSNVLKVDISAILKQVVSSHLNENGLPTNNRFEFWINDDSEVPRYCFAGNPSDYEYNLSPFVVGVEPEAVFLQGFGVAQKTNAPAYVSALIDDVVSEGEPIHLVEEYIDKGGNYVGELVAPVFFQTESINHFEVLGTMPENATQANVWLQCGNTPTQALLADDNNNAILVDDTNNFLIP